jgi:hypothetical protein
MDVDLLNTLNVSADSLVAIDCLDNSTMDDPSSSPGSSPSAVSRASSQHSFGTVPLPALPTLPMVTEAVADELSASDARRWSSLLPDKMSFGRRKAVAELLGTEEHYLQDLKHLLEGYRQRMDSANVRSQPVDWLMYIEQLNDADLCCFS